MAIAAIENDKISERAAAERFGVPHMTLVNRRRKTATVPNGTVAAPAAEATKGRDGKSRKPPATPEEIARAWEMKESGMSTPAIAKDLGRPERTVRGWWPKGRPEAEQAAQPPAPAPVSQTQDTQPKQLEPLTPTGKLGAMTKTLIKLEKSVQAERAQLLTQALQLADHLNKHLRSLQRQLGKHGAPLMYHNGNIASKAMARDGAMAPTLEALGLPLDSSLEEALWAIEALGTRIKEEARNNLYVYGYIKLPNSPRGECKFTE